MPAKLATNPYRLRTAPTANTVCLNCHLTSDPGYDPPGGTAGAVNATKDVGATHFGGEAPGGRRRPVLLGLPRPARWLATNILMVKDLMSKASDTYGVPTTTTSTLAFTANTAATDFVDTTARSPRPVRGSARSATRTRRFRTRSSGATTGPRTRTRTTRTSAGSTTEPAQPGAGVHDLPQHQNRFEASCTDCHGTTARTLLPGQRCAERGSGAEPGGQARGAHRADRRGDGRLEPASNASTCNWCHPNGAHSGDEALATPGRALGAAQRGRGTTSGRSTGLPDTGDGSTAERELQQRELPLQQDGDDRRLVRRTDGQLRLLPRHGTRATTRRRATPAERAQTHVDEVPPAATTGRGMIGCGTRHATNFD